MTKVESQKTDLSFEAAMERLESVVSEMESSKLPLAELLLRYEEGSRLIAIFLLLVLERHNSGNTGRGCDALAHCAINWVRVSR
jgi:hypothetical protein